MIRKAFILSLLAAVFMYLTWNFYLTAIKYDPLGSVSQAQIKDKGFDSAEALKYAKAWTKEIYEKNLFSPSRSYMEPKPVALINTPFIPPPQRPNLVLKGIVLDTFGDFIGLIEINQSRAISMRKGDKIEDVELIDISSRQVVLKWETERIMLNMDKIKTINNPRVTR